MRRLDRIGMIFAVAVLILAPIAWLVGLRHVLDRSRNEVERSPATTTQPVPEHQEATMESQFNPMEAYAKSLLEDQQERVRFQHEFALAGMRTLVLINGGAIIGLLTYAGNVLDRVGAASLGWAFLWYVAGLVCTTIAYVFAYFSQGMFLDYTGTEAYRALGLHPDPEQAVTSMKSKARWGYACIGAAVVLTVMSLGSFVTGSVLAMLALT